MIKINQTFHIEMSAYFVEIKVTHQITEREARGKAE